MGWAGGPTDDGALSYVCNICFIHILIARRLALHVECHVVCHVARHVECHVERHVARHVKRELLARCVVLFTKGLSLS